MNNPDPDRLSDELRSWRVNTKVPADFQREVWQRIAHRQSAREDAWWPSLQTSIVQLCSRPITALVVVMISFSTGLALAHEKAATAHAHAWQVLEDRYANTINPLARHVDHLAR